MLLYLKSQQKTKGYTVTQVNTFPLGVQAVGIVSEFIVAFMIDRYNLRILAGVGLCVVQAICCIVLLIPSMTTAGIMTALYLAASAYGVNPLLYGWSSVIAARGGDDAVRSVV